MGYKPTLVLSIYFNIHRCYYDFSDSLILNVMLWFVHTLMQHGHGSRMRRLPNLICRLSDKACVDVNNCIKNTKNYRSNQPSIYDIRMRKYPPQEGTELSDRSW